MIEINPRISTTFCLFLKNKFDPFSPGKLKKNKYCAQKNRKILQKFRMIKLKNNIISRKHKCFIIAEIGSNHNNKLSYAYKMIDLAKKCGADAVKFQTFKVEKHFSKFVPSFKFLKNKPMYELIKKIEINRSWHKKLYNYCKKKKLFFFHLHVTLRL